MAEISWTLQSIQDIEDIAEYIAKDSEAYANMVVKNFFDATDILAEFPEAGRIVPEFNVSSIREIITGHYRIIYYILSNDKIEVLTVHHSYRLLNKNIINKPKA